MFAYVSVYFTQDPSSIEHETAPESGDMYAVIDKPKRKSKKQAGAPDVVPEKTEEELLEMNATPDKSRKQKSEEVSLHNCHVYYSYLTALAVYQSVSLH